MRYLTTGLLGVASLAMAAAPAGAADTKVPDAAAQALDKCVRLSTNGKDRIQVARWFLVAMASAPQMQGVLKLDPQAKDQGDRDMAALFTRLLTVDCRTEAKGVFNSADMDGGFGKAGEALGEIAMQELFGSDLSASGLLDYTKYLDPKNFAALLK